MPLPLRFRRGSLIPATPGQHLLAAACKVLASEQEAPQEDFRLEPVYSYVCKSCFKRVTSAGSFLAI